MLVADTDDLDRPALGVLLPRRHRRGRASADRVARGPPGVARAAVRPQADRVPAAQRAHHRARPAPRRLPRDHRAARRRAEGAGRAGVRRARPAALHAAVRDHAGRAHDPAAHREPRPRALRPGRRHLRRALPTSPPTPGCSGRTRAACTRPSCWSSSTRPTPAHFREVTARDVVELAEPVPLPTTSGRGGAGRQGRRGRCTASACPCRWRASSRRTGPCCGGPPASTPRPTPGGCSCSTRRTPR